MALYEIKDLTFTYPGREKPALSHLELEIQKGEWITLWGPSGSGKSTLLRHLKPMLAPYGSREGRLFFKGKSARELSQREQAFSIGFLGQDPDRQLVTDKVWHELAFGLESLGLDSLTIRRRVAEMASFFGIGQWFHSNTDQLSGGQKQLLNLAAVMVMQPEVLLLDEPAAQLDPIAGGNFFNALEKINRELGTTIIMTEHRLEEALPLSDRMILLEEGKIALQGEPGKAGRLLWERKGDRREAMPVPFRIYCMLKEKNGVLEKENQTPPLTVREGRRWLEDFIPSHPPLKKEKNASETQEARKGPLKRQRQDPAHPVIFQARHLWMRYEKDGPDVLKDFSYEIRKGQIQAILGPNGCGKTTAISALLGAVKCYRGSRKLEKGLKMAGLAQDPQTLFLKDTLREDLLSVFTLAGGKKEAEREQEQAVLQAARQLELEGLLSFHPYDLSGGEQQRAALAKVLLTGAELIFLDEPTKGMDSLFKRKLGVFLKGLAEKGAAIVLVSHDVEFCAAYAHRCGLFFDGALVSEGRPWEFFAGNRFYTTAADRMCRELLPGVLLAEEAAAFWEEER